MRVVGREAGALDELVAPRGCHRAERRVSETADPDPGNDSDTDVASSMVRSDLTISLSDRRAVGVAGLRVTFDVIVTNAGPSDSPDATVSIRLPDGVSFVAGPGCAMVGDSVVCELQAVASPGQVITAITVDLAPSVLGPQRIEASFYTAMARLGIPLITHAGEEKAVHGAGQPAWGNPLRLRRALDHGVRVVIAHCASLGEDQDEDRGRSGPRVSSFSLFSRLMGEQRYAGLLYGDISAINLRNRDVAIIRLLLEQEDWHPRLLFGTDYPLPGILPLVSARQLARERLLDPAAVPVLETLREHNPLLFDFVLKRHLRSGQRHFARGVFETRNFFDRKPA